MNAKALAFATLILAISPHAKADQVKMVTYHDVAPFITGPSSGLTHELALYLTRKSGGQHTFVVEVLPRKRLDIALAEGQAVVVPWATPVFFQDEAQSKYRWSATVIADANVVVSPTAAPVEYSGPDSLVGKTIGGINGHRYGPVDGLVNGGKIKREDAPRELLNLRKAAHGRVDATIMAESVARFLMKQEHLTGQLHVAATPHSRYDRKIFVAGGSPAAEFVINAVAEMTEDAEWQAILAKYFN